MFCDPRYWIRCKNSRNLMSTIRCRTNQRLQNELKLRLLAENSQIGVDIDDPAQVRIEFEVGCFAEYRCAGPPDEICKLQQQGVPLEQRNLLGRRAMNRNQAAVLVACIGCGERKVDLRPFVHNYDETREACRI